MLPSQHGASGFALGGEVESCSLDLKCFCHEVYYVISLVKVDQDQLKCVWLYNLSTYSEGEKDSNTWVSLPHLVSASALATSTESSRQTRFSFGFASYFL